MLPRGRAAERAASAAAVTTVAPADVPEPVHGGADTGKVIDGGHRAEWTGSRIGSRAEAGAW